MAAAEADSIRQQAHYGYSIASNASSGLALLLLLAIASYLGWRWATRRWKLLGPLSVPYFGGVLFHALNFHRLHDSITDYCRTFRTFRAPYPAVDYLYTVDPDNIQHMLKTNFSNYIKVHQRPTKVPPLKLIGLFLAPNPLLSF
jgi:hypothetical protein